MTQNKETSQPKDSLDIVEQKMDALQFQLSVGAIAGSVALAIQHMVISVHSTSWVTGLVSAISVAGWALFGIALFRMNRLGKSAAGKAYNANAQRDERIKSIRSEAYAFGFWAVVVFQAFILIAWVFFHDMHRGLLTVPVVAPTAIAIGVTASLLRFQNLSKK